MAQLIITAVGPDRPGLVGDFTGHLHAAGANILDSRMVNLRGQFALVLLMEAAEGTCADLARSLPGVGQRLGLAVQVRPQDAAKGKPVEGVPYKLKTYSMDQPGIVHRVTQVLQAHGVNIEDLASRHESAPFMGSPLFTMEMRLTVPPGVGVRKLRGELEALCDSLNCDVDLEPA
jgi:glycine cleavage system transcriptional repressor